LELITILAISLGLSMDCFGVAIINGMAPDVLNPGTRLKIALSFALAHFIMFFAGFHLGLNVVAIIKDVDHWIAFTILSFVGAKMIISNLKANPFAKTFDVNNIKVILGLSVATSIDALIVGISMPFLYHRIGMSSLILAITVFVLTLIGINSGKQLGYAFGRKATIVGGVFLIGIGLAHLLLQLIS